VPPELDVAGVPPGKNQLHVVGGPTLISEKLTHPLEHIEVMLAVKPAVGGVHDVTVTVATAVLLHPDVVPVTVKVLTPTGGVTVAVLTPVDVAPALQV
jgi:hypothetical protein